MELRVVELGSWMVMRRYVWWCWLVEDFHIRKLSSVAFIVSIAVNWVILAHLSTNQAIGVIILL